jgi:N-methylhydantoinase A
MLDIHTVGAGGGSIAYVDSGGLLKVGPRSCGADPGPVCYDRGNQEPAVTDANVLLQTLNPTHLLGGRMPVRQDLARAAIARLAGQLRIGVMETAQGILSVVTANMAKAIRVISVQRGYDPRDYTLMAFGGAGPLHAARLAKELDIARILVPPRPGILCAMGLLLTDLRADFAATKLLPLASASLPEVREGFAALAARAEAWFGHEDIAQQNRRIARTVDMRYAGQNYELSVALPDAPIDAKSLDTGGGLCRRASPAYGFIAEDERSDRDAARRGRRPRPKASLSARAGRTGCGRGDRQARCGFRKPGARRPRSTPRPPPSGNVPHGPCVIEQMDATTLVCPG